MYYPTNVPDENRFPQKEEKTKERKNSFQIFTKMVVEFLNMESSMSCVLHVRVPTTTIYITLPSNLKCLLNAIL
jgi:hypothetical protein